MGVKECFRAGCDSVMCDDLSDEHGYICLSCKQELIDKGPCDIKTFMDTPKPKGPKLEVDWEGHVNKVFGDGGG